MSEPARASGESPPQPTLVAGEVTLRPWRLGDESTILPLYDTEMARWFGIGQGVGKGAGKDTPVLSRMQEAIRRWHQGYVDSRSIVTFLVVRTSDPVPVGTCQVKDAGDGVGVVSWTTYGPYRRTGYAATALHTLCRYAFDELGLVRLEAYVSPGNTTSMHDAVKCGFGREGLLRGKRSGEDGRRDLLLYARLVSDPAPRLKLPRRGRRNR